MTLVSLLKYALSVSIFLLVFAMGLRATFGDATYLFRRPQMYLRCIFSMNIVMVVFAVALVELFDLHDATKIALVALALSPVPPLLPQRQTVAGGDQSFALGLLFAAAVTAIVLVPLTLELLGRLFDLELGMPLAKVAPIVLVTVIVPLAAGMTMHYFTPAFSERIAGPLFTSAIVLLAIAALPLPFLLWPQLQSLIGDGTLAAMLLFSLVGLTVGHLLGGPSQADRAVLSLATAARHPGLAIAIAGVNFPDEKGVLAAVLWHLIVAAVVAVPYILWARPK